jgi:hypothetical protein
MTRGVQSWPGRAAALLVAGAVLVVGGSHVLGEGDVAAQHAAQDAAGALKSARSSLAEALADMLPGEFETTATPDRAEQLLFCKSRFM